MGDYQVMRFGDAPDPMEAELEALRAERKEWAAALQSLTPGGSEFQTPEACADFVRDLQRRRDDKLKDGIRERRALAAENAGLRGVLSPVEWVKLDGGTFCPCCQAEKVSGHDKDCALAATLASPSPLTAAIQRVLEAATRERAAELLYRELPPPIPEEYDRWVRWRTAKPDFEQATEDRKTAVDHLQALLEGRSEP